MSENPALALIRESEGLSLKAYLCPAGKWTIGYGHTARVTAGQTIDVATAETLLAADAAEVARQIESVVQVPLTAYQLSALTSFVYNIGLNAFLRSRLLKRLNAGEVSAIPFELNRWVYTRGRILPGLVKRRAREAALWEEK